MSSPSFRGCRHWASLILIALVLAACLVESGGIVSDASAATPRAGGSPAATPRKRIPVLAYYYIWFEERSWRRAKTDYPWLGRYASDDRSVMRQHIRWAKDAGVDGFIVSWKNTEVLSGRLEILAQVAAEEDFKLAIIYQGLDFERDPIDATRVADDLDFFLEEYGANPVFAIFDRPLVIWSGTWEFSADEISAVTYTRRGRLLILASERNERDYVAKAEHVDGNAYYWSSVNPDTFPGYVEKLQGMGEAARARGGLWIAPAAPGFDARLVGGERTVERRGGAMLRRQLEAAAASSPDAIGLISWNEFSENSHVEPSCDYDADALTVLARLEGGQAPSSLPDHCAEAEAAGATSTPSAQTSPVVEPVPANAVDLASPAVAPTRTPWPTPKDAAGFVDPVRPNGNSDFDSSSPAATDRSIGRVAWVVALGMLTLLFVAFAARRARDTIPDDADDLASSATSPQ